MAETMVRERPILFSGDMVRAILDGAKTQTRRVVTNKTALAWLQPGVFLPSYVADPGNHLSPYGYAGDRLWVRETFSTHVRVTDPYYLAPDYHDSAMGAWYWADGNPDHGDWTKPKPSIFMPRWACRLELEVTDVCVERLQAISEDDAIAEGVNGGCLSCGNAAPCECGNPRPDHRDAYAGLWNDLNEKRGYGWNENPWVWVVSFRASHTPTEETV